MVRRRPRQVPQPTAAERAPPRIRADDAGETAGRVEKRREAGNERAGGFGERLVVGIGLPGAQPFDQPRGLVLGIFVELHHFGGIEVPFGLQVGIRARVEDEVRAAVHLDHRIEVVDLGRAVVKGDQRRDHPAIGLAAGLLGPAERVVQVAINHQRRGPRQAFDLVSQQLDPRLVAEVEQQSDAGGNTGEDAEPDDHAEHRPPERRRGGRCVGAQCVGHDLHRVPEARSPAPSPMDSPRGTGGRAAGSAPDQDRPVGKGVVVDQRNVG